MLHEQNIFILRSRLLSPRQPSTFLSHQIWSANFRDYNSKQALFVSDEDNSVEEQLETKFHNLCLAISSENMRKTRLWI